jgi:hypothetical protein
MHYAMKTYADRGQLHALGETSHSVQSIVGWVDSRAVLDVMENTKNNVTTFTTDGVWIGEWI